MLNHWTNSPTPNLPPLSLSTTRTDTITTQQTLGKIAKNKFTGCKPLFAMVEICVRRRNAKYKTKQVYRILEPGSISGRSFLQRNYWNFPLPLPSHLYYPGRRSKQIRERLWLVNVTESGSQILYARVSAILLHRTSTWTLAMTAD
jgi:hypothetical protein